MTDRTMTFGEYLRMLDQLRALVYAPDGSPEDRAEAWRDVAVQWKRAGKTGPPIVTHIARPGDDHLLDRVAVGVFDGPVDPALWAEFLAEPSHILAVAIAEAGVVAMASGVRHVHPDKPAQLWINEVGTADAYQRQGLGRAVVQALLGYAMEETDCTEAWVLTDEDNAAARGLYRALGGEESGGHVMVTVRF